jgi:hypothetical protein
MPNLSAYPRRLVISLNASAACDFLANFAAPFEKAQLVAFALQQTAGIVLGALIFEEMRP